MNAQEILEKIKVVFKDSIDEFAYTNDWEDKENIGIGDFKEVDQHGGEGEGERWWSVKHFSKHNIYIKVRGFYSSYNGTDFDYGWGEEVKPQEKVVTVYQ